MSKNPPNCYHLFGSEALLETNEPIDCALIRSSVAKGYVVPRGKPETLMSYVERFDLQEIYDPIVDEHHEVQKLIIKRLDLIDQQEILIEKKKLYCKKSSFEMLLELGDLIAQDFNFQEIKFKEHIQHVDDEIIRCRIMVQDKVKSAKSPFVKHSVKMMKKLPPVDWLIEGLIQRGTLFEIYGPPGCGKSFVVADMMMKACTGRKWADRHEIKRPLNIAYCTEESFLSWKDRLNAALVKNKLEDLDNLHFYPAVPQLFDAESNADIFTFINDWRMGMAAGINQPLDILIIDTLHCASEGARESDADDARVIKNSCKIISSMLGCSVGLVHHSAKDGTSRGSTAINGSCEVLLNVVPDTRVKNKSILTYMKVKESEKPDPIEFGILSVEGTNSAYVVWNPDGENQQKTPAEILKDRILEYLNIVKGEKYTAPEISKYLNVPRKTISECVNRMVEEKTCLRCDMKKKNSKGEETKVEAVGYYVNSF